MSSPSPPARPHVLHVINRLSPSGGAEVSLVQLLPHLTATGVRSTVVTLRPHVRGSRVDDVRAGGTEVHCLDTDSLAAATARLTRLVRQLRPDVVHTTLFDAGVAGRLAARVNRLPGVISVVNTVHADAPTAAATRPVARRLVAAADRALARHATVAVHAITTFAADAAVSELGVPAGAVTVIPRGRDRALLGARGPDRRRAARERLGVSPEVPVLLSVGRQERQKAQHHLVETLGHLRRRYPRATLLLAGRNGGNSGRVESAVRDSGLPADAVRLLGPRDDVADLHCAADVFVLPSAWEGLGGVVLEAMAMGTPVVTTDLPPVREVLAEHGLYVPVGDAAAMAAAVGHVLDDPAGAAARAAAARVRFDEHYTIEAVAARMAQWYRAVIRVHSADIT